MAQVVLPVGQLCLRGCTCLSHIQFPPCSPLARSGPVTRPLTPPSAYLFWRLVPRAPAGSAWDGPARACCFLSWAGLVFTWRGWVSSFRFIPCVWQRGRKEKPFSDSPVLTCAGATCGVHSTRAGIDSMEKPRGEELGVVSGGGEPCSSDHCSGV